MKSKPKAFISHASEDKERFVLAFATALRTSGIDAWVDQWEISAGDSLVRRVFAEGIEDAAAFVVVLSEISVTKPWVTEELDAGVIRKIAGQTKLIPVLIEEVDVPPALKHLKWLSLQQLGFEDLVAATVNSINGVPPEKPPLGDLPAYLTSEPALHAVPSDDAVFSAFYEMTAQSPNQVVDQSRLQTHLSASGLSPSQIDESVKALRENGTFDVSYFFGGNYAISHVNPVSWLEAAAA